MLETTLNAHEQASMILPRLVASLMDSGCMMAK
jgi:hypothetical protein